VAAGDAPQYDLARIAQRIVMWRPGKMWTLWLLLALPFAVLVTGRATLLHSRTHEVELPDAAPRSLTMIPAPSRGSWSRRRP
jgi:hypothetical protein